MKNLVVSFSGGRTSAFMAKMLTIHPDYKDRNLLFLYANTGKENEETLKFIDRCDKEWNLGLIWLEADVQEGKGNGTKYTIVDFESASRNGEPFEAVIKKYGLPSKLYRHCTREMKQVILNKYGDYHFGRGKYLDAVGIRADEPHRITNNPSKVYPLAELGFTESMIRNWWDKQTFDLNLKDYEGNCDLCFLKSVRKKMTLLAESPNLSEWWNDMEVKYSKPYQDKFDVYRNLTIPDLLDKSKETFSKVRDKHEIEKEQTSLFDVDIDMEFDCFCKNT